MAQKANYTFEDCIKKCESIIDGIYQDGYQSIHLYSLKTFIYGMVDIHNKTTIELQDEVNQFRAIGTIEEFKALKEDSRFLEFLYNHILPNEMEQYLSMYKSSDIKTNGE